jgi:hypothetical protein
MSDINIICPVCENDITISARNIKLAVRNKLKTGGSYLVSCPDCCRTLRLPNDTPESDVELDEWPGNIEDVTCISFLNDEDIRLPAGMIDNLGKKKYRPGGAGPLLEKHEYMMKYGINPECAIEKMNRPTGHTFHIGK